MTDLSPRADIPFRINLEQQKKRAKELLRDIQAADKNCIARLQRHHPKYNKASDSKPLASAKLSDAQLVIARELGPVSYTHLTLPTKA